MDKGLEVLSNLTIWSKYARYIDKEKRRETWDEIVDRYEGMMVKKFPSLSVEIAENTAFIRRKEVLPSMRALQFAGTAAEVNNARMYNCAYMPIDSIHSFNEAMFLLLGGSGVGYSVQEHHVAKLPSITIPTKTRRFLIQDDIMGWADSIKMLMKAYLGGGTLPVFDFRAIREKGARLITAGGKAPGPEPLKECLRQIKLILDRKLEGEKLTDLECHDIMCHIANAVLAGGIRRAAMISLFSKTSRAMLTCKHGEWWVENEQRGRANNSVILLRGTISEQEFKDLWVEIKKSGSGEPGIYWTNDLEQGTNPCCEIALNAFQFCNLCEINVDNIEDQEDLNQRATVAAFFGTLQASFTDFHYLRPIWKKTTEKEALLGIGQTGIGSGKILDLNLEEAANAAKDINYGIARVIGINPAARVTCIKPSGTTSCVLGCSSGIHAWYAPYYLRTIRFSKHEDIATYLMVNHEGIVEQDLRRDDTICVRIPIKAPEGSIFRTELALDTLERVKKFSENWIKPGYRTGVNGHNVSATVNIDEKRKYYHTDLDYNEETGTVDWEWRELKKFYDVEPSNSDQIDYSGIFDEWVAVGDWMWENKDIYNGLSVMPFDNGTYIQAPFEEISEDEYNERIKLVHDLNVLDIIEMDDTVNFQESVACSGGACEIV